MWFADKVRSVTGSRLFTSVRSVRTKPPKVTGLAVAGLFFPLGWPVAHATFEFGSKGTTADFMSKYLGFIEEPYLHPKCVEASKEHNFPRADCFDVTKMLSYTKSPIFTAMNRFDSLQIEALGLCFDCKPDSPPTSGTGKFIRYFGHVMNQTVFTFREQLFHTGWFIPNEWAHDNNFYRFAQSQERKIDGLSYREAYERWYAGENVTLVEATCNSDGPCPSSVHGLPDWGERELTSARFHRQANSQFASRVTGNLWLWISLALVLLCCCAGLFAYVCRRPAEGKRRNSRVVVVERPLQEATQTETNTRNSSTAPPTSPPAQLHPSVVALTMPCAALTVQPPTIISNATRMFSRPTSQGYSPLDAAWRSQV